MAPVNRMRKRTYAMFSESPMVPIFKEFDDIEFGDVDRCWSINCVQVEAKFPVEDNGETLRFILMDATGSKIEAFVRGRNVHRFNIALNEGCKYNIHRVKFQPNYEEIHFRNIQSSYECLLTNRATVEPSAVLMDFPLYPKRYMPFQDVYARPNKSFVDIVGVVVHVGDLEHQQSFPRRIANREYTLLDTSFNLIVVQVWDEHLTQHMLSWLAAEACRHVVLATMLKKDNKHGRVETTQYTKLAFAPDLPTTHALQNFRRPLVAGAFDLTFIRRFIERRREYLAHVV